MASQSPDNVPQPLKPLEEMLEAEIATAAHELERSVRGLFLSALLAGQGVAVSLLLLAAVRDADDGSLPQVAVLLVSATVFAVGFVIVILGRMDLFTEFTTIAILPVLRRRASLWSLMRLWLIVYTGNVMGAAIFAGLAVVLLPTLDVVSASTFIEIAEEMALHRWWVILLSSVLAGWLMGLLSWLIAGGRDTTSQILFVWLITGSIGIGHFHHCITGTAEVLAGVLLGAPTLGAFVTFLVWATLGNAVGGFIFALSVHAGQGLREKR